MRSVLLLLSSLCKCVHTGFNFSCRPMYIIMCICLASSTSNYHVKKKFFFNFAMYTFFSLFFTKNSSKVAWVVALMASSQLKTTKPICDIFDLFTMHSVNVTAYDGRVMTWNWWLWFLLLFRNNWNKQLNIEASSKISTDLDNLYTVWKHLTQISEMQDLI